MPAISRHYVRRGRLVRLLGAAAATPVTAISAPAGAGKTTLVAGWVTESHTPTAWVSLDVADQNPHSFWTSVIAALQTIVPDCGDSAMSALHAGTPVMHAVDGLLDELDAKQCPPMVLVIDDLHLVDDNSLVAMSLRLFVEHIPQWLRIILISRREPNLPRDQLRDRGRLEEVHFAELRFSPSEARELMRRFAAPMSERRVRAATAGAAGWAVGLQLAALAARSERAQQGLVTESHGDEVLVQDYVLREVLVSEAPELVDVLSDVSVVDRVNAGLAAAVTGRRDAYELLERAEARGLFLTRIDPAGWYELHPLIRAALSRNMRRRSPDRLAERHVRAAQWYQDAGEPLLALEHWFQADRPREALRLLAAQVEQGYDVGLEATVRRAIGRIAPEAVTTDLESLVEYAWCNLVVDRRRFLETVEQASWLAEADPQDEIGAARVTMLRSIAATVDGRWVEGGALARRAMQELGRDAWRDPVVRYGWNTVARELALTERWDDTRDEVRQIELAVSRDPRRRLAFEGTRAMGNALAGHPVDALRVSAGVRHAASVSSMTVLRAELALADAVAYREVGDQQRALAGLHSIIDLPAEPTMYCKIIALLELAQAHVDTGDLAAARAMLAQAELIADQEAIGPDARDRLTRFAAVLGLAMSDLDGAGQLSDEIRDPFWRAVSTVRVLLAAGRPTDAIPILDDTAPRCARHEIVFGLLAAQALSDREKSIKHASIAIEKAAATGALQTVVSEGPVITDIVEHIAWRLPPLWVERFRRAVPSEQAQSAGSHLIEPLTDRERDVLRFLPSRLTVREIADELFVSVNTLKFHLKMIYRKLGVSSRAEAADAARSIAHGSQHG